MPSPSKRDLDWGMKARMRPTAKQISELVLSHGWIAADERWSWLDRHTLTNIMKAAMDPDEAPEDFEVQDLEP